MNSIVVYILRFLFLFLLQVLVLNQVEIGYGIQIMTYPLFMLLLPVELGPFILMLIAFGLGAVIDVMSNTYGLHTSSLLVVAYFRPMIFKFFAPRDGYDAMLETNLLNMGFTWFLKTFGILLLAHHLWFFMVEWFKLNDILYVLQKTALSGIISFVLCVLLQYLFISKSVKEQ